MRRYRFVHAADLHLDSPFRGLSQDTPATATALHQATFQAYDAIIDLCLQERVDALLVAGDIYDGADRSLSAQLRFNDGLQRLAAAGIRAFICHGNHDPLDGWEARIAFPDNVVRFGPEVSTAPLDPSDPTSPLVYGISYPTREMRENLIPLFPPPEAGRYAIGLLHANVGSDTGHDPYAPCSLEDLERSGYDYWALGHVHTRQVMRDRDPIVIYPGNPQARHANERGPRGVYLVEIDEQGHSTFEFRTVDVVRWDRIEVDITGIEHEDILLSRIDNAVEDARTGAEGRPLVYRLRLVGRGPVHAALVRDGFLANVRQELNSRLAAGTRFAFCERIEDDTAPAIDREALRQAPDLVGDLLRLVDELTADPVRLADLRTELQPLYVRARRYLDVDGLGGPDLAELVRDAEQLLLDELLESGTV